MKAFEIKNAIEDYHKDSASLSKTSLSLLLDRPSRYWKRYLSPPEAREPMPDSCALSSGDALHCLVLEPELFTKRFAASKYKSKICKGFVEDQAAQPELKLLTITQYENVRRMADALLADKVCKTYLRLSGEAEKSFYWQHEKGVLLKCRPDFITTDSIYCLDIKTTKDLSPWAFARDADKYKYWLSAAMTLQGVEAVRGVRPEAYVFLCVENLGEKKPDVASYFVTSDAIELGDHYLEKAVDTYKLCLETGHWPAVSEKTKALELMPYRHRELEKIRENRLTDWSIANVG